MCIYTYSRKSRITTHVVLSRLKSFLITDLSTQESFSFHHFHIDTTNSPFLEELFEAKAYLFQNCPSFVNSLTLQSAQY